MSNPYNFFLEGDEYCFVTNEGISYNAYFIEPGTFYEQYPIIHPHVLEFGFYAKQKPKRTDTRVGDTIICMLQDFFHKNPDGILYFLCDSVDAKQLARHRKFEAWFLSTETKGLVKHNFQTTVEGLTFYFSLVFKSSNAHQQYIEHVLENLKSDVSDKYREMF